MQDVVNHAERVVIHPAPHLGRNDGGDRPGDQHRGAQQSAGLEPGIQRQGDADAEHDFQRHRNDGEDHRVQHRAPPQPIGQDTRPREQRIGDTGGRLAGFGVDVVAVLQVVDDQIVGVGIVGELTGFGVQHEVTVVDLVVEIVLAGVGIEGVDRRAISQVVVDADEIGVAERVQRGVGQAEIDRAQQRPAGHQGDDHQHGRQEQPSLPDAAAAIGRWAGRRVGASPVNLFDAGHGGLRTRECGGPRGLRSLGPRGRRTTYQRPPRLIRLRSVWSDARAASASALPDSTVWTALKKAALTSLYRSPVTRDGRATALAKVS